jgi:hypothetical protein
MVLKIGFHHKIIQILLEFHDYLKHWDENLWNKWKPNKSPIKKQLSNLKL